jgi:hypothetical protein
MMFRCFARTIAICATIPPKLCPIKTMGRRLPCAVRPRIATKLLRNTTVKPLTEEFARCEPFGSVE